MSIASPNYRVIHIVKQGEEEAIEEFEKTVTKFLQDGWSLVGGVAIYKDIDLYFHFYQAIVKV